jgi:hypothetical protein
VAFDVFGTLLELRLRRMERKTGAIAVAHL